MTLHDRILFSLGAVILHINVVIVVSTYIAQLADLGRSPDEVSSLRELAKKAGVTKREERWRESFMERCVPRFNFDQCVAAFLCALPLLARNVDSSPYHPSYSNPK